MKMVKKLLAVALAGVLALTVLTGCSSDGVSKDILTALNEENGVTLKTTEALTTAGINFVEEVADTYDPDAKVDPYKSLSKSFAYIAKQSDATLKATVSGANVAMYSYTEIKGQGVKVQARDLWTDLKATDGSKAELDTTKDMTATVLNARIDGTVYRVLVVVGTAKAAA